MSLGFRRGVIELFAEELGNDQMILDMFDVILEHNPVLKEYLSKNLASNRVRFQICNDYSYICDIYKCTKKGNIAVNMKKNFDENYRLCSHCKAFTMAKSPLSYKCFVCDLFYCENCATMIDYKYVCIGCYIYTPEINDTIKKMTNGYIPYYIKDWDKLVNMSAFKIQELYECWSRRKFGELSAFRIRDRKLCEASMKLLNNGKE
jgi:hypothetical protein